MLTNSLLDRLLRCRLSGYNAILLDSMANRILGAEYVPSSMNSIVTARLRLVPSTAELIQLEIENLPRFFRYLGVEPISDWPSDNLTDVLPFFRDQLASDASLVGWLAWYWILDTPEGAQIVGGGGFKGAPTDGKVEIGYETRAGYQRTGIATEAVSAQVAWALKHPDVSLIIAETREDNLASLGVLNKVGFVHGGLGSEAGLLRFERRATDP
jgi:RimJ/RimL family protein N-acetyltransferase